MNLIVGHNTKPYLCSLYTLKAERAAAKHFGGGGGLKPDLETTRRLRLDQLRIIVKLEYSGR